MRFRGKSIRRKIVALLLVPLVSLTGIWGFATVLTGREVNHLFDTTFVVQEIGYPTEDVISVLQDERRQTLVYLADPRASDALADLRRTRTATDEVVSKIRRNAKDADVRDEMSADATERLAAILDAFDGIGSLRQTVEDGTVGRDAALHLYNRLVDPCYILLANLQVLDNVDVDKQSRALVNMSRARELLAREDALLGSALVVGRVTRDEARDISDLIAQRTLMYDINLPQLPSTERARYDRYWKNASTAPLRVAEQSVLASTPGTAPRGVTAKSWDGLANEVLDGLDRLDTQAGDRFQDRVRPVAVGVIVKAAVAGVLGLAALLVSLFMSVRIGRGLIRDLRRLRQEAHETAGVRLPSVMRRLSAGEQVDVETEVPRLEYEKNEIGEVSQALNILQRSAVEAAVKQSELRSGVSEVFVNLARRSQVLLHKQLTLLDTMERRTEDTDELADLFRLDHLTTRMRRHAEGLVILSGAAPSRQWRKPVQLMDVVRAAVAEVEDYERIEVRRLPRMAVTGSAVADLTHLVAELLENATVFSPPHTAVQVLGERVANGFTLEIHDRGLGMAADALLDANLRLAETPEFELSDTDRLGLFVVSRLAQRQNVRVSLQPSPYGGTTAVVFVPDALLSDDVPDTNGVGFRLDRALSPKRSDIEGDEDRKAALSQVPVTLPGLSPSLLDGPVELEAPVGLDALEGFPGAFDDEDGERGGIFRPRRSIAGVPGDEVREPSRSADDEDRSGGPLPLPHRRAPKLVSSHGRPVTQTKPRRDEATDRADTGEVTELPQSAQETAERSGVLEELPKRSRGARRGPARREAGDSRAARRGPSDDWPAGSGPADRELRPAADRDSDRDGERIAPTGRAAEPGRAPVRGPRAGDGGEAPVLPQRGSRRGIEPGGTRPGSPADSGGSRPAAPGAGGTGALPRRVRQANLAPQLKDGPDRRAARDAARTTDPTERDADEVRSRMASLQRGWQRGRVENAAGDEAQDGTAPGTTKGDGR
ncbi:nitrate- and nitrite sensing domain-containing protein [Streptomyces sp. BV286]|uniref:nitrate- and nitrite sensing domain-containing protein n=1 Tax=unclassified Streptomyces TaxID=2593676 RepID=UPI001C2E76CD|nr:nitrate- and nitrite sensing domain-containing protein [Streptomyces sp. BV286]MBV1939621.1 nitrate- and nitrite sensing domain-containing protein [Streptomyces sp. BV286]